LTRSGGKLTRAGGELTCSGGGLTQNNTSDNFPRCHRFSLKLSWVSSDTRSRHLATSQVPAQVSHRLSQVHQSERQQVAPIRYTNQRHQSEHRQVAPGRCTNQRHQSERRQVAPSRCTKHRHQSDRRQVAPRIQMAPAQAAPPIGHNPAAKGRCRLSRGCPQEWSTSGATSKPRRWV
jgi:hypothetical protein